MSAQQIRDYLQTQGLKLPFEAVQIAQLAAQTVIQFGQGEIEPQVLWYERETTHLTNHLPQNSDTAAALKSIWMALDATQERSPAQKAAIYWLDPDSQQLIQVSAQGEPLETLIAPEHNNEATSVFHLAARSAHTGWLNHVSNTTEWLEEGHLSGSRHQAGSQLAIPICQESGRVLGIIYLENPESADFDDTAQIHWVGLALALVAPFNALLEQHPSSQIEEQPTS